MLINRKKIKEEIDRIKIKPYIMIFLQKLTNQFGHGFCVSNLRKMKKFYNVFKGGSIVWNQLSWSYNHLIVNIEEKARRDFYLEECIKIDLSVRQLER